MHRHLLTAGCIALLVAQPALAQTSQQGGCIGATVTACVALLRATMSLDEGLTAGALARRHKTDVNGRPIGDAVTLFGRLPGRPDPVPIELTLTPDDRVAKAAARLLRDPRPARTEEEYADTGLYDLALRLAGNRCPDSSPLALYRFFENVVKPRLRVGREDLRGAAAGGHLEVTSAERVPYCGVSLTYIGTHRWSGTDDWHVARKVLETHIIRFEQ